MTNKYKTMKMKNEIEKIIKHHLRGNYLQSDAGIALMVKDIENFIQTNQPESPKLGEICIACNEPFRLYGTVLLCQCNNDSDSWKQVAHHVSELQKIVRNEPKEQ